MKNLVLYFVVVVLFFGYANPLIAQTSQEFKIPSNYSFKSDDDYRIYEPSILECIAAHAVPVVTDIASPRNAKHCGGWQCG